MQHATALKTTSLGGAIRYTLGIWDRLTPFLDHPERSGSTTIRPNAGSVARYSAGVNHFGSKSARGTEVAAILYSLVESAKASGIDPIAYLTEVATRAKESSAGVLLPADFSARLAAA
jgi:formylmethanofuran dehydrogenase subunit A